MKKKRKKTKKLYYILPLVCLIFVILVSLISMGIYIGKKSGDRIFRGISVGGVDISELKKDKAREKLEEEFLKNLDQKFLLFFNGDEVYKISYANLGYTINLDELIERAYAIGREGNIIKNIIKIGSLPVDRENLRVEENFDKEKLEKNLKELEEKINRSPKNAILVYENGQIKIIDSVEGRRLDLEKTRQEIIDYLSVKKRIELPIEVEKAEVTSDDFKDINGLLGEFTTQYSKSGSGRKHNIALAASRMSNFIIKPGQEVSFNDHLGDISKETGYEDAGIIVNGEFDKGVGGGVCQVSTTFYNALLRADVKVTERSSHSLPVGYVPMGTDAAISTGYKDLKFKNNYPTNIYVLATTDGDYLNFKIFGDSSKKDYEIRLRPVEVESIDPAIKEEKSDELYEGEQEVKKKGSKGYRYETYKQVVKDDKILKEEKISKSYYIPQDELVLVGTKKREEQTEQISNEKNKNELKEKSAEKSKKTSSKKDKKEEKQSNKKQVKRKKTAR